ncbi:putative tyrosine--tRNA ligase [Rosa chinensis]|uniref:tyrosine--tRNA ligase n=1 Tax=Rosa chinensis TaxID=74649 RepID=A0A2P6SDI5_ROSCH|nr:putative tyrosine--tRNA ligase [Rosa chinensis]
MAWAEEGVLKAINVNKMFAGGCKINARSHEYWPCVMDIARKNKLSRIIRCSQIIGRMDQEELAVVQILYPCMQCRCYWFWVRRRRR